MIIVYAHRHSMYGRDHVSEPVPKHNILPVCDVALPHAPPRLISQIDGLSLVIATRTNASGTHRSPISLDVFYYSYSYPNYDK